MLKEFKSSGDTSTDPNRCGLLRIPSEKDIEFIKARTLENARRHLEPIRLRPLDHDKSVVDEVYHEARLEEKVWMADVEVLAYVDWEPDPKQLTKWGIDQPRDAVFFLVTKEIEDHLTAGNLTRNPKEGDLLLFDDNEWEAMEVRRSDWWANATTGTADTPTNLGIRITANRRREEEPSR